MQTNTEILCPPSCNMRASWLISSNAFDVIGAATFGMNSVWIKRTEQQRMDPWGGQPMHTIQSLSELEALF